MFNILRSMFVFLLYVTAVSSFCARNTASDRAFVRSRGLVQKSLEWTRGISVVLIPPLPHISHRLFIQVSATAVLARHRRQDSSEFFDVNSAITDPELNYGLQSSEPKGGRKRSKNTIHDREDAYYGVEEVASDGYRGLTHSDSEDKELDESLRESSSDAEISGTYGLEEDNTDVNYSTKEIDYIVEDLDDIEGLKGAVEDGDKEDKVKTRIERRLKRLHRAHLDAGVDVVEDAVPPSKLPIIAVIGRPNTGKSTIVNRICDTYNEGSIVDDAPGVTRDRSYRPAVWNGYNFQVVDTGGILFDDKAGDVFTSRITEQAMIAIDEAVACVFVCDGIAGVTDQDRDVAEWLRRHKSHIPIYLAVNKCESEITGIAQALDFNELGLGEAIPVSGIHGIGIGDVLDKITENHMKKVVGVLEENVTNVAFIGRPNVGKSSLFNKIYGKNRTIVSDVAGTTRDPIDEIVTRGSDKYRIIDTAGIRKKSKVDFGTEFFMINRAFKAIRRADVCVLLLDATQGVLVQDRELADRIVAEGRACVIALNKWDVVPSKDEKTYIGCIDNIHASLNHLRWAEVVLVSAKTGQRIDKVLVAAKKAVAQFRRRVATRSLTEVINDALNFHSPPRVGSKSGRIHYCVQSSTAPPTFVLFCNDPKLFSDSYRQYLERKIRESLGFDGTPIRILFRQKTLRKVIMSKDANGEMKRKYV